MKAYLILLLSICLINISLEGTKERVEQLFEQYDGEIWSGYLNTKIEGNELFYIYIPSQTNPSTDPVLLWLNGGPGCSSLFGMLGEIGPVTSDNFSGEWKKNPYSWNINANLLFIEQPAGVGFSKTSDFEFHWTDEITAENLLAGIKDFFKLFSDLKGREFYVSGESYAGVYIPHLATKALEDIESDKINFKGTLVGNGLVDLRYDVEYSMVEFGFWRGIISIETYESFKRNCPHLPDELHPEEDSDSSNDSFNPRNVTQKCNEIRKKIMGYFNGNDVYGIYRKCPFEELSEKDPKYLNKKNTMKRTILRKMLSAKYKNKNSNDGLEPEIDIWPYSCEEDLSVDDFLNIQEVKEKLHVADPSIRWTQCAGLDYEISDSIKYYSETMLRYPDLKTWVFSGTEDVAVGTLGTVRWIDKLGFKVETEWRQWKTNDQVSGYVQKYEEGLVIVTVKGAGHMVPQDKRADSFQMVSAFLKGELP